MQYIKTTLGAATDEALAKVVGELSDICTEALFFQEPTTWVLLTRLLERAVMEQQRRKGD
jgi:phenylpyruvate tautomerase PptA (4-oxalocrotonate tautomerase family)